MLQQAAQIEKGKIKIFSLKQQNVVKAVKIQDMKEKFEEFAKEGNMKAICKGLVDDEEGKLENKDVLLGCYHLWQITSM